jgi:glutamate carboxypeptidase
MIPASIRSLPEKTEELCARLTAWAHINSGSTHIAGLARMRDALASAFGEIPGVTIEIVPLAGTEACALRVRCRPGAPRQILFSGHYDTVYDAAHSFQTCERIDARTLRGPGVADMKGGLLVMLTAAQLLETSPAAAQLGWEALLTPDEEIGSAGSAPVIAATARRHRLALVFEPARGNGDLVRSRKGTGNFSVTCHGRAAHAGRVPNNGRNAIVALAGSCRRCTGCRTRSPDCCSTSVASTAAARSTSSRIAPPRASTCASPARPTARPCSHGFARCSRASMLARDSARN